MARKQKRGLEYFPFDVGFFQDMRVRKLIKHQSGKAVAVYALLLCIIYKQGYYMRWDEELPFIISEQTGYDEVYIREVIKCCLNVDLLSRPLFESERVLTSVDIQERYLKIRQLRRRSCDINEYCLLIDNKCAKKRINVQESTINVQESGINVHLSALNAQESRINAQEKAKMHKNADESKREKESPPSTLPSKEKEKIIKEKNSARERYSKYFSEFFNECNYEQLGLFCSRIGMNDAPPFPLLRKSVAEASEDMLLQNLLPLYESDWRRSMMNIVRAMQQKHSSNEQSYNQLRRNSAGAAAKTPAPPGHGLLRRPD